MRPGVTAGEENDWAGSPTPGAAGALGAACCSSVTAKPSTGCSVDSFPTAGSFPSARGALGSDMGVPFVVRLCGTQGSLLAPLCARSACGSHGRVRDR